MGSESESGERKKKRATKADSASLNETASPNKKQKSLQTHG